MSRWELLISEYDVKLVTPTTIKSQALADLLSICPEKATIKEEERMSLEGKTNNWRMPIHEQLRTLNITKETRGFCLFNGKIFKKSNDGLLMKCVGEDEGKEKAEQLHGATCGKEGPGLYGRLQRWGIYWPKMKSHCDELQAFYKACQETKESTQICNYTPNGHCILLDPDHETTTGPINFKYVNKYYA
ncbi:hypothetical protein Ahy_B06g081047 [Arachis hypogaea]|uniref:Integrase zinc-binding domain-containing protein n=1 Tax=Arachis hypogaea TaxID=3818 RepID=A0A444YJZ5_ARAHY|nr:hypothetical protein Ahy_B06g081047 [Arachis hypogaea]